MDQPAGLQVDYVFRGVEHAVRVVVSGQVLELEVEDRMTADQWRGEFDASFIEDLTHKTGNFKQFNIFCNMLESALTQSNRSVVDMEDIVVNQRDKISVTLKLTF